MLLILAASNGQNLALAQELARLAGELEIEHEVLDLVELGWPLFAPGVESPANFEELDALFQRARGFLVCAPEYNGSTPPTLSSLIAWLSVSCQDFRAVFNGKPAAIATFSGGGGQKVLFAMRLQLAHLGCNVLGRELLTNKNRPLAEESARAVLEQLERAV
jgi:NAD(P)H-dependent FMN reductase